MNNENGDVHTCRIRLVGLTPAAVSTLAAASFAAHGALAAPGDLDPAFGDAGRVYDLGYPTLWSLDVQDDGALAFGAGDDYCGWYYTCDDAAFGRLLHDGTPDASFAAATLAASMIYDTALQPDGKLVAVGHQTVNGQDRLMVLRLQANGAFDDGFAAGGIFLLPGSGVAGESARSVLLEDDGRIVVLGNRGARLIALRLTAAGVLDETFGTGGIAEPVDGYAFPSRVAHAAGAGYRLLANVAVDPEVESRPKCYVFGLTEAGARDGTFGTDGRAPVPGGPYQTCSDFAVAADGAIVLGGRGGFLARLLPSGAPDPAFATDVLPDRLTAVSAIRFGSGGRIFVAGNEPGGLGAATVVRLLADGTLDTLFGTGGTTQFVMKSYTPLPLELKDMKVIGGNALVLGGGTAFYGTGGFVVRLLGDDAGSGPGIVTVGDSSTFVTEADGQATVRVRRIGGTAGTVTVNYATQSPGGYDAVAGQDYTPVTGSLSWNDGESDDREITVPILADAAAEGQEMFQMVLESVEGGAGFGAKAGDIFIAGASYPNGSVSFEAVGMVTEGASAQVYVGRNDYCVGAVSVTVHLAGGTAEPGVDFNAQNGIGWSDVTLTWADGQCGTQSIYITTLADKTKEQDETMRLELVSPTGGAQLGVPAQTSVTIRDPIPLNRGGGGALGGLGAALLGLLAALRGRRGRAPAA